MAVRRVESEKYKKGQKKRRRKKKEEKVQKEFLQKFKRRFFLYEYTQVSFL